MNVNLGDDLARTFSAAAGAAPQPRSDFAAGVARRRRRNGRVRRAGLVSVAAVIVVVSGAVAVVGLRGAPAVTADPASSGSASASPSLSTSASAAPSASVAASSSIDLSKAPPADTVWPEAVVTLPAALPDGRRFAQREILDDDRLLVVPGTDALRYHMPVVYNQRTRQTQELMARQTGYTFLQASVGVRSILVIVGVGDARELWTAPKTGGPAVKRAAFTGKPDGKPDSKPPVVTSAFEAGDGLFIAFTSHDPGKPDEVLRVRADGTTEKAPATEGWRLGSQPPPWLVETPTAQNIGRPAFRNVATGELRTARPLAGLELLDCSPEACASRDATSVVTYRWDGGGRHLRATGLPTRDSSSLDAIFDATGRFVQIRIATRSYLWDLRTNRAGRIDSTMAMENGLLPLGASGGGQEPVISTVRIG